ncbi:MAG: phage portal protein family protein, partial [Candidatus Freyarchaeota archaeon]
MAKDIYRELGHTGTEIWSGYIERPTLSSTILSDDYLTDWTVDRIDRMLRSDGQVAALWRAISLSIQGAEWTIEPASGSKEDRAIADFVEKNLWPLWPDFFRQALLYLPYGFMLFEVVYEPRDGQIYWKKLAPRLPWTVDRWYVKDGQLDRVVQYAQNPETGEMGYWEIPAHKILRFTNEQQGLGFEGTSLFRAAYKHWKIKDVLYKIAAIKHERWGVGLPVGTLPQGATRQEEEEFKKVLKQLRSNEAAFVYLPRGANIDESLKILVPQGGQAGSGDIMEMIRHHDVLIARSALAEFLSLGETRFGSRAVSQDMTSLFLMNLEAIAKYISQVVTWGNPGENRGIADLVRLNFGEEARVPTLRASRIKRTDVAGLMSAVARLFRAGALTPDEDVENTIRTMVGLPKKQKEKEPKEAGEYSHGAVQLQEGKLWRDPFPWEEHVRFEEYLQVHTDLEEQFVSVWRGVFKDQLDYVAEVLGPEITPDDLPKIRSLTLPYREKMVEGFYRLAQMARQHGRRSVYEELMASLGVKLEEPFRFQEDKEEKDDVLKTAAEKAARTLSERTRKLVEDAVLPVFAVGVG